MESQIPSNPPFSPINLHQIIRQCQLKRTRGLIPRQLQIPIYSGLSRRLLGQQLREYRIVINHALHRGLGNVDPPLDRRQRRPRERRDSMRQRIHLLTQQLLAQKCLVDPTNGRRGFGVDGASGENILQSTGASDQRDKVLQAARPWEEVESDFELGKQSSRPSISDVALDGNLVPSTVGAAGDLGDEDNGEGGERVDGGEEPEAGLGAVIRRGRRVLGAENMDVIMGDPEIWVCAREDDDFDIGLVMEGGDQGEKVCREFLVVYIDRGVVDAGAQNATLDGRGYSAIAS